MFAGHEEYTEVGDAKEALKGGSDPIQDRRRVAFDPPPSISRRSAATSMATAAASVFFSTNIVFPAVAAEDDIIDTTSTTTDLIEDSKASTEDNIVDTTADELPVAKEKMIVYTVQDFSVALPVNWKVITKYDEKATKPPSTPTLFSAIDFNSGAVLSIVKEEACSVSEYARSSFEKSKKKPMKKCDFAIRNTSEEGTTQVLFSPETYEKDASKLLLRHDDRDNAVLRGVSRMEESALTVKGGRRRRHSIPPSELPSSFKSDVTSTTDSFSSPLLELRATTTIPTSGTYRDGMGLEQPNTIERKVLAKAVAITTRVTQTTAERTPPPSDSDSTLLATEKNGAAETNVAVESEAIRAEGVAPSVSKEEAATTNSDPGASAAESTTATASAEDVANTESDGGVDTADNSPLKLTAEAEAESDSGPSLSSNELVISSEVASASTEIAPEPMSPVKARDTKLVEAREDSVVVGVTSTTKAVEKGLENGASSISDAPMKSGDEKGVTASISRSTAAGEPADSTFQASAPDSPMTAMMAMTATIVDEPIASPSDSGSTADTVPNSRSEDQTPSVPETVETAIEKAQQRAIETVIEEAKERAVEQAIATVKETAKETAKEVALELLAGKTDTSAEASSTGEPKHTTTNRSIDDSEVGAGTSATASDSVQDADILADTSMDVSEESDSSPPSDASLLASAHATTPGLSSAVQPHADSTTTTTTSTTVLSIWLSAPLDEWQKPVMGTKLNKIWESVEYADNIVDGTDSLAMSSLGDDESSSINTQLLLMNNKSLR